MPFNIAYIPAIIAMFLPSLDISLVPLHLLVRAFRFVLACTGMQYLGWSGLGSPPSDSSLFDLPYGPVFPETL